MIIVLVYTLQIYKISFLIQTEYEASTKPFGLVILETKWVSFTALQGKKYLEQWLENRYIEKSCSLIWMAFVAKVAVSRCSAAQCLPAAWRSCTGYSGVNMSRDTG